MIYKISVEDRSFEIKSQDLTEMDWLSLGEGRYHIVQDGQCYNCTILDIDMRTKTVSLELNNEKFAVNVADDLDLLIAKMGLDKIADHMQKEVKAPMPGLILDVLVEKGQSVSKDDDLVLLEAMKMENILKAEGEGIIKNIVVNKGDSVEKNQVLIELE